MSQVNPFNNKDLKEEVVFVPISSVKRNSGQPRQIFAEKALVELSQSIKNTGVIQPLIVSRNEGGFFDLIAGERRLRASIIAGLKTVPVIIRQISSEEEFLNISLVENIQREELNPIEEARVYKTFIEKFSYTQEKLSEKVGKERSTIANMLRLLELPQEIQNDIADKALSLGHAKILVGIKDRKLLFELRNIILKKKISVRSLEMMCQSLPGNKKRKNGEKNNPNLEYMADKLRSHLRTKVNIRGSSTKGLIQISFFSSDELERIINLLKY